jgi:hypothetical protein
LARFLALDWDTQQLHVVAGAGKHTQLHVRRAFVSPEETAPNLASAEALGKRLAALLKAENIPPAPVYVCVGRDRVILKEIGYPPVPAAEEPAVVRFQALKELTHAPDEVVIDYFPTGETGPQGERRALVLILRRELLTTYQALCKAAGLKLAGITPRPFGTAACVQRALPPDLAQAPVAVLTVADRWTEFCVVHNGSLRFARALAAPAAGAEPALLGEIRRNLAVYAGQAPQAPVRALFLADSAGRTALRDLLQNTLAIPVHLLDPFLGAGEPPLPAERRGAFAGAVGVLQAQAARGAVPINFAQPKEPKPERDPNKLRVVAAAALAAVLLVGAAVFGYVQVADYDNRLQALRRLKLNQEGQLVVLDEESKRIYSIGEWAEGNVCWLDELYDLTERFPDGNSMRLTQFAGEPLPRATTANGNSNGNSRVKAKARTHTARLVLKGITTLNDSDRRRTNALIDGLAGEAHYGKVDPVTFDRNAGVELRRYPQKFATKVEVAPRPPADYRLHLSAKPPARDAGAGEGFIPDFGGFGGNQ